MYEIEKYFYERKDVFIGGGGEKNRKFILKKLKNKRNSWNISSQKWINSENF